MYSLLLFIFSLLGVLSHLCYFIHGEHHEQAPRIARIYFLSILCLYAICVILSVDTPIALTACIAGAYFSSLCASIAIYRVFFHQTKNIPGPRLAAVTKLYQVYQVLDSRQYLWLDRLNKKYGDFVRTGTVLKA